MKQKVRKANAAVQRDEKTIEKYFRIFRVSLMLFMENTWNSGEEGVKLGGPGMTVEIDESCCTKKRKYNRGSGGPKPDRWVFGMVERLPGGFAGRRRFFLVPNRRAETLIAIIERNIRRGSHNK